MGQLSKVTFIWIPAQRDQFGNEQTHQYLLKIHISNTKLVAIPFEVIKESKVLILIIIVQYLREDMSVISWLKFNDDFTPHLMNCVVESKCNHLDL